MCLCARIAEPDRNSEARRPQAPISLQKRQRPKCYMGSKFGVVPHMCWFSCFRNKGEVRPTVGYKSPHTHTPQDSIYSSKKPKTVQSPSDHYAFKALFVKTPKQNPSRPAKPVRAIRDHSMESSSISAVYPGTLKSVHPCYISMELIKPYEPKPPKP